MKTILRFKWGVASALILLAVLLFVTAPPLADLVEEKGSVQLADTFSSSKAASILEDAGENEQTISVVVEFADTLSENEAAVQSLIEEIEAGTYQADIEVLSLFESDEIREQVVSDDESVALIPITVDGTDEDAVAIGEELKDLSIENADVYITGEALLNHDVDVTSQEGLAKTEIITVILIFVLLLVVFRAIVTPLVPLLSVGLTYLISQSIVSFLADWFDFPISNYTQIFLVAVLFGIGTDYCILLLSRYKEELAAGHDTQTAILNTYRTAGKTLFYSGLAVFIGFAAIGFADFKIYQSAVGVAVGIAVLLLVLYTFVPFLMAVLKQKLFWPSKKVGSHADNKLWGFLGKVSIFRPVVSLIIVAIITVPFLFIYNNDISFNNVDEISTDADSVKGLRVIETGFGIGNALPLQVVMDSDEDVVTPEILAHIEALSRYIAGMDQVDKVIGITRPAGEELDDLYVDNQLSQLGEGLDEAVDGTIELEDGLTQISDQLRQISDQVSGSTSGDSTGSLGEVADGIDQINEQLGGVSQQLQQTQDVQTAAQQLAGIQQGLTEISAGLSEGAAELEGAEAQVGELSGGLGQLADGVDEVTAGIGELRDGITDAADFANEIAAADYVRGTGVYIPDDLLDNDDFQDVIDLYTFTDQTGLSLDVNLVADPYSIEGIDATREIKTAVTQFVQGTPLQDMTIEFAGVSSLNSDLEEISSADFTRTVMIILAGLFITLMILLRSWTQPIVIIGGLLLSYYTSLGIAELVFVHIMGYPGLSWAVPFFGFVMLIALGVDYSIFLFDRYQEEKKLGVREGLMKSMVKMGSVIITAAIILSGTFGAMMPSGVLSLMQIGTVVVSGLMLFGLVILPLFIPAVISLGEAKDKD
ncbi:MMPL family transporter [Alkalicoccobacillus murimartini]|uniref:RND superfamily putative drug exporter n=1 Tax=Alkalicoccobacillus murimartini TaxID=171685 RepID=A0ABT9YG98_9BACI|nr:MMPL family transporter [Alkalicoccobacillus murimartini]MDQ0206867.1 RND superfamily putative drug exporter [Alkalicoccobacillus murimartini]